MQNKDTNNCYSNIGFTEKIVRHIVIGSIVSLTFERPVGVGKYVFCVAPLLESIRMALSNYYFANRPD